MIYNHIEKGIFLSRPNRFIAHVMIDGKEEVAHVKNTGRCRELLIEGAIVYLQKHENSARKTNWSLICVNKGGRLINIDSQAPNKVFYEWLVRGNLLKDMELIKPEFKYGDSRVDFYVKTLTDKVLIEVKGATLEEGNIAMFPDAPTVRGVKHIYELCKSMDEGYKAYIVFVIQMKGVQCFIPNEKTHKEFADALRFAKDKGVEVLALDCEVGKDFLEIWGEVEVVV